MKQEEIEELLWEVGRAAGEEAAGPPGDEELRRYREASLAPDDERRLEELLATSPLARARLAELGGVAAPPAAERVRRRILGAVPAAARRRRRVALPLAAGLALTGLALWLALRQEAPPRASYADAYEVTVEGLAALRGQPGSWEVLPDTRVRVRVEPRGEAASGVEFGLYRRQGARLVRLSAAPPVTLVESRGAVQFSAPAAALVGAEPGVRSFYVVAAPAGELPPALGPADAGGEAAESRLAAAGKRFVRAVPLKVLEETSTSGREE
jgi:hypothetical protein